MKRWMTCAVALLCCALGWTALAEAPNEVGMGDGPLGEVALWRAGDMALAVPEDTDDVLINPGKGFVFLGYMDPDECAQEFVDVISIGYNRFNWSRIEPEEGVYDWDVIDGYVEFYEEQGKQFAFGVMCANTSATNTAYVTPEWVFDSGAEGKWIATDEGADQFVPSWTDPIFLEKLGNFIETLAERYDGNPTIAFMDIRSYGNWGEQHTYKLKDSWPDITAEQLRELYLKPYMDAFRNTQLVIPYGGDEYEEAYAWAIEQGATIRRDGIVTLSNGSEGRMVYGKAPAIFEYPGSYMRNARSSGDWQYDAVEQVVEIGAPTYLQIYEDMYLSNEDFYNALANRIGYYFRLKSAKFREWTASGDPLDIELTFRNDGVAPIYRPASLKIGLLDAEYRLVQAYPVQASPEAWMPGKDAVVSAAPEFALPEGETSSGEYIMAVGLFADDEDDIPDYQLGSGGSTEDHWYAFGKIEVETK